MQRATKSQKKEANTIINLATFLLLLGTTNRKSIIPRNNGVSSSFFKSTTFKHNNFSKILCTCVNSEVFFLSL